MLLVNLSCCQNCVTYFSLISWIGGFLNLSSVVSVPCESGLKQISHLSLRLHTHLISSFWPVKILLVTTIHCMEHFSEKLWKKMHWCMKLGEFDTTTLFQVLLGNQEQWFVLLWGSLGQLWPKIPWEISKTPSFTIGKLWFFRWI